MKQSRIYRPKHKVRIVTAASLFDGHDAAINIMRRILQATGVEVIHLGHDRSVAEVVDCAIQEDVQGIAMTSYQGGHNEYFRYMYDLLREKGAGHIRIFGGGGGVILPQEVKALMDYGIARIYTPDDGRRMGLQGMIDDVVRQCDYALSRPNSDKKLLRASLLANDFGMIARLITMAENEPALFTEEFRPKIRSSDKVPVLGITGTGGAGKSSVTDELVRRFLIDFPDMQIGILSVDPSKRRTGGALLGDRIRMNAINTPRVYMRSLATREANRALSAHVGDALDILRAARTDLIILESSGIGQSDSEIVDYSTLSLYVMTPEYGAASQLEKIDMLDFADVVAVNKFEKRGGEDALRDVARQYARNHGLWDAKPTDLPIFGTIASRFNDPGTDRLYLALLDGLSKKTDRHYASGITPGEPAHVGTSIIPPVRIRYLSEIVKNNTDYDRRGQVQSEWAQRLYGLYKTMETVTGKPPGMDAEGIIPAPAEKTESDTGLFEALTQRFTKVKQELEQTVWESILGWDALEAAYTAPEYRFRVRDKEISIPTHYETLSHIQVPKVVLPGYKAWGDRVQWLWQENVPGRFPFTAGVFPFKREGEDPTRMFAGEGGPERTNKRFHYLSRGMASKRLSTAFDSVTLYGGDPDLRPDIYGKIGNSGVSVCCLDDVKRLYSGFDLSDSHTSVSMTINGPAPMLLAYFLNAAIDQGCEKYIRAQGLEKTVRNTIKERYAAAGMAPPTYDGGLPEGHDGLGLLLLGVTGDEVLPAEVYGRIAKDTMGRVRGTVQADILKEDQAQNTCIFSTEFALRLMGDVQEYFIDQNIGNFYSVSISGYHIAEAGANPITQLAFTLANGFTYVEYYLARGMDVDAFGPNLSFFFSNGIDAEYAVIGRVARRIWSKAMRYRYGASSRAQMLKYHVQTSGRSLHAQEIDFNDIRTTLQALYAIYDNCNSLHTNAYDEAITTPTEESVRRALAIQLIINKELGLARNENPLQGSFIIETLTDLVEEAVLMEFERISERGGVLGAMETMYQRTKIQEESLYYERLKHSGEYPIIGVNTFLGSGGSPTILPSKVIRATDSEKQRQIETLGSYQRFHEEQAVQGLERLRRMVLTEGNTFETLMDTAKYATLGQMTNTLFEVGGRYRRNM